MEIAARQGEGESVSAFSAEPHDLSRTEDWFLLASGEEVGELTQAYLARSGRARDKGRTAVQREEDFRAELSDVFAQVLLNRGAIRRRSRRGGRAKMAGLEAG